MADFTRIALLKFLEWRIRAIVIAVIVSIAGTALVYYSGYGRDPATHFGAVFAGWVGGLALFVVAGAVVAIVSLVKPEDEFFDYRARILFRRQTGKHIDYIVDQLKSNFEFYAEQTSVKIVIKEYDASEKKFRVEQYSKVTVRSYIDDIPTSYKSSVDLKDMTLPPPGKARNRLTYVRINTAPEGSSESFDKEIHREFSTAVAADQACEVDYAFEFWVEAEKEPLAHTPKRYTQNLVLTLENLVDNDMSVNLKLMNADGTSSTNVLLIGGHTTVLLNRPDIPPGRQAYDLRFCPG